MLSRGIVLKSMPSRSISFSRRPLSSKSVLDDAVAPKPRRSTMVVGAVIGTGGAPGLHAGFPRQHVLNCRSGRAGNVFRGDHASGCADDAGRFGCPDVDGRQHLRRLPARQRTRRSSARAPRLCRSRVFSPMTQRSFVCAPRMRGASGETKPDAKDAVNETRVNDARRSPARMSWEISLSRPSHRH